MSASQPKKMEPDPNEKMVRVYFVSDVDSHADMATVVFPRVLSLRESEFTIRDGLSATLRIPTRHLELNIDILFPGSTEDVRVTAAVIGAQVDSLRVRQVDRHVVFIDILHSEELATEHCTVTCESTGESRTGMGACIDCKGDKGVVRLCC